METSRQKKRYVRLPFIRLALIVGVVLGGVVAALTNGPLSVTFWTISVTLVLVQGWFLCRTARSRGRTTERDSRKDGGQSRHDSE